MNGAVPRRSWSLQPGKGKRREQRKIETTSFKDSSDQPGPPCPSPLTPRPSPAQAQIHHLPRSPEQLHQQLPFLLQLPEHKALATKPGVSTTQVSFTSVTARTSCAFPEHYEAGLWVYIGHHLVDSGAIYFQATERSSYFKDGLLGAF